MKNYSREIRYTESFDLHEGNLSVLIQNGKEQFFFNKLDWDTCGLEPFDALNTLTRYRMYPQQWWSEMGQKGNSDATYDIKPLLVDPTSDWKDNEHLIGRFEHSSHMVFSIDELPFNRAYRQDYVGGIDNLRYDLEKIKLIMEEKKNQGLVLEYHIHAIPAYNADRNRTHAVDFTWRLPIDIYQQKWKQIIDENKQYPSIRMKELFQDPIFGFEAAKRSEKEIEDLESENETDSDEEYY